jgi:hypothetical protein
VACMLAYHCCPRGSVRPGFRLPCRAAVDESVTRLETHHQRVPKRTPRQRSRKAAARPGGGQDPRTRAQRTPGVAVRPSAEPPQTGSQLSKQPA